jgi:hypothetical protein
VTAVPARVPWAVDAAFAINVNLLWTAPAERSVGVLARALRPAAGC